MVNQKMIGLQRIRAVFILTFLLFSLCRAQANAQSKIAPLIIDKTFTIDFNMKFQLEQATEILRQTPSTLNSLLRHISDEWIFSNEGLESWSPYDVVGHLIHAEETDWISRAKIILEYGETHPFEPFDRFAMFEKSKGKSLTDLLAEFERRRQENLKELEKMCLTPQILDKRGKHPELGEVTLGQLLATWVVHDLGHIGQVVRVLAKQYKSEVGPWKAYLPILIK